MAIDKKTMSKKNAKPKICMVAYTYYERDPRVRREAEALVNANYDVLVIALKNKKQSSKDLLFGVNIFHLPISKNRGSKLIYILSYLSFFILAFVSVSILQLKNHFKIIHIHNMPNFLVFTAILPKVLGVPIILDIHDPMPELFGSIFSNKDSLFTKTLLLEEKISCWFADQLITVHKGMFDLLTSRGINKDKLAIIHNLPDPAIFNQRKNKDKSSSFTLVYAGTVSPRHNLSIFLKAINKLKDKIPLLRLMIVGDGPDLDDLQAHAKELKIERMVDFLGVVSVDEVPKLLAQGDVAIASYENDDFGNLVFPTKAIEALMVGLPVLCTRVESVVRYIDEETLFYFKPDDLDSIINQIILIKDHPEIVKKKINSGKKFLSQFNWDREKNKLIQLINDLVDRRY